ncbi:hypothetical protein [Pedobacter rhodius]|uniref:Uncharacterized protein n=1 Tax=Pedobacter rhodius TaxID=3004098 RepID=A0ABT4KXL2_9SPHI|nr:hypothetical protein [Pedobacter sp. SJ11]MCZ4222613.1 hypothetical protein [Pedobacter sp. SJ11]
MINTFDFSSYFQPSECFKENSNSQVIQEHIPDLKEKREHLLKGLLEDLNKETELYE